MSDKSAQRTAYLSQLVDVLIVIAGNQVVTQCAPDKDYEKLVYHKLIDYLKSRRFNSDFGLEIMKRKNLLQPMVTIEAIDDAMYEEIEKRFPVGEDLDEKTVSNVSARFSTLKSECRNIYLPHYLKDTKIKKSGEYVDDDILLNIYEMAVKARIDTNCYKAKRILVADLKSKNTSVEDIKEAELKFVNNKLQGYEDKKIAWKLQTMPTGILAFILCSSPGKKLACLEVEGAKNKNIVTKGSNGRKAMREVSNMKTENEMITPAEGTNVSKNAIIGLKQNELDLKKHFLEQKAASKESKDITSLLKTLEKMGLTDSIEYKTMTEKYLQILRARIYDAEEVRNKKRARTEENDFDRLITEI